MKILIADDNEAIRQMIRTIIQPLAKEIYECSDGSEAIEIYSQIRPDWVLIDFEMPQVDGLTATRQIIASDPNAHILLVTHHDDEDLRSSAREAGTKGFVLKDDLLSLQLLITKKN